LFQEAAPLLSFKGKVAMPTYLFLQDRTIRRVKAV